MHYFKMLISGLKVQRKYFISDRSEITSENLVVLQIAGFIGTLVCLLFFVIAPIIIPSWSVTTEYLFVLPVLISAFLFAFFYSKRSAAPNHTVVEVVCAVFYSLLLAVFIALSVFPYPNTPQIFISLCFMFMPTLLIQRPAVLVSIMGAAELVFIVLALKYKTTFSIENDIFNTIAAMLFSFVIMGTTNRLRWRNYSSRKELKELSQTDALTGLLNKAAFESCAATYLNSQESAEGCALLVVDVDDFKQVNDKYGHPAGDSLLASVGAMLRRSFRQSDLVGRIGGDEFAVLLRGVNDMAALEEKCARLREHFSRIRLDEVGQTAPTCSIGGAVSRDGLGTYIQLFHTADELLYQAKLRGKDDAVIK